MATEKAKHKHEVLSFWRKHGLAATIDAYHVTERTLYRWKKQFKQGDCHVGALDEKSKRPKKIRKRDWSIKIKNEIRKQRDEHANLGKEKVHKHLTSFCQANKLKCPSIEVVGFVKTVKSEI